MGKFPILLCISKPSYSHPFVCFLSLPPHQVMLDLFQKDPLSMPRILDVCQDVKATFEVLENSPLAFGMELAALAARRDAVDLDKWLKKGLVQHRQPFARAALRFLEAKLAPDNGLPRVQLSVPVLKIFLGALEPAAPSLLQVGGFLAFFLERIPSVFFVCLFGLMY